MFWPCIPNWYSFSEFFKSCNFCKILIIKIIPVYVLKDSLCTHNRQLQFVIFDIFMKLNLLWSHLKYHKSKIFTLRNNHSFIIFKKNFPSFLIFSDQGIMNSCDKVSLVHESGVTILNTSKIDNTDHGSNDQCYF